MKKRMKQLLAALLIMTLMSGTIAFSVPYKAQAAEAGIDVSAWQGEINWQAVAQSGVTFAFIRVGSLSKGLDKYFYQNMLGAQAVGIKTGVYIYSTAVTLEQVALEALFVLQALENVSVSFPVVYDIEDSTQQHLPKETLALFANTFCAIMEQNGYYPMVYANTNWYTKKLGPIFYDKWVAQWANHCDIPDASVWQYSSTGKVPGIKGNVDLDLCIKDYSSMFVHTGFVNRNGNIKFLKNYRVHKGLLDLGTAKYYFDETGKMYTGFLPYEDTGFFFKEDGTMAIGLTQIADKFFFFGADGLFLKGLQNLGGQTYFFDQTGAMYFGFLPTPGGTFYFEPDGHMATGIVTIDNAIYYFDENGIMQTGIVNINGTYFYFDVDGKLIPDVIIDPSMVQ